ncbi:hypothetical protein J6590_076899 [Homalodisca vitripennis]|nr:hypothetical protein J6590_076899 [Homalodisca vitripennis]
MRNCAIGTPWTCTLRGGRSPRYLRGKVYDKMAIGDEVENCPCCKSIVNESDIALNCDGFCKEWYHGSCVKISSDEYVKINVSASKVKWYCDSCSEKVERMISKVGNVDDFLGLNNTVKQLVEMVKGVCNDNICVGEKLSEVSSENARLCNEITLVKQDIDKLFKVAPTTFSGLNGSNAPPNVINANTVTNAVDDVVAATNPTTKLDNGLGADRFPKVSSRLSDNISDGKSKGNKMNRNRTFTNSTSDWKVVNYQRKRGLQSAVSNNSSVSEEQENLTNTKPSHRPMYVGGSLSNSVNRPKPDNTYRDALKSIMLGLIIK